jgi:hypothetical protein
MENTVDRGAEAHGTRIKTGIRKRRYTQAPDGAARRDPPLSDNATPSPTLAPSTSPRRLLRGSRAFPGALVDACLRLGRSGDRAEGNIRDAIHLLAQRMIATSQAARLQRMRLQDGGGAIDAAITRPRSSTGHEQRWR